MMKAKQILILFILLSICLPTFNTFTHNVKANTDWIIDGNSVYVNDENVFISATPHTLNSNGWVVFEFETKNYDGNIDITWGFDISNCKPRKPQIWRNYTHELKGYRNVDKIGDIKIYNVSGWDILDIVNYDLYTVDYGNRNNTFLFNISFNSNKSMIVAFSSYVEFGNGDDYELTGYYNKYESYTYYKTFFDWQNWIADFEIINFEYGGMDKWFLLQDIPIISNHRYKVRVWIDAPINTIAKYWWALKPSDKTIQESITNGVFYCLDPWIDFDYGYKKKITINHTKVAGDLVNFPVLVSVTDNDLRNISNGGHVNTTDGYDIVFTNSNENTFLNHEIEYYDETIGKLVFWVNVTSISSTVDTDFYIYYGKDGVIVDPSSTDTWDSNFVMVHHMDGTQDTDCDDSTSNNNDVSTDQGNPTYLDNSADIMGYGVNCDNTDDSLIIPNSATLNLDGDFTLEASLKLNAEWDTEDAYRIYWKYDTGGYQFLQDSGRLWLYPQPDTVQISTEDIRTVGWHYIVGVQVESTFNSKAYYDGVDITEFTYSKTTVGNNVDLHVGSDSAGNFEANAIFDELRISKIARSENWLSATYETQSNPESFLTWGIELNRSDFTSPPVITNKYPLDNSTNIVLFPVLSITINDTDGNTMAITWLSNVSGEWATIGYVLTNVLNGTYYQKFTEFAIYNLTYYWNTSVSNGFNTKVSNAISFTSEPIPTTTGGNDNGSIGLLGIFGFLGFIVARKIVKKKYGGKK